MKKQVLVISNMYPTKEHLSFGIFVKNQVEALKKHQIDVVVCANEDPATGAKNALKKYMKWAAKTVRTAFSNWKNIGLTHAHYAFPSGFISLIIKKVLGIPYIVTVHGGDIERMARKNAQLFKITRKILSESSHVIAVGEQLVEQLRQDFDVPSSKISLMSMGVNREVFKKGDMENARLTLELPMNEHIFLFVGNVIREKGVEELIRAFKLVQEQVKDVRLIIIGSTRNKEFVSSLNRMIEEDSVNNVTFVSPVKQDKLVEWFNASNVFVLPSHLEGFGLVALEALATGTPVIASDTGGLTRLLSNGAGHLVPPKNVQALSEEMLVSYTTSYEQYFNQEQVSTVLEENDEERLIEKLINLYQKIDKEGHQRE